MLRKTGLYAIALFAALVTGSNESKAQVDVSATAGTLIASYPNLSSAFTAINSGTHQGDITIFISSSFTDVATAVLNSSGAGSALYTSVYVRPFSDGLTISYASASGRGLIELNGADNVTIDGDNPNTAGINRNLNINNTAISTTTLTSVIRIANSTAVTSSDNITIKNCNLNGSATNRNFSTATSTTGSENNTFGIYCGGNGGATATTAPTAITSVTTNTAPSASTINTLLIDNNAVNQCARGIVFNGASSTVSNGVSITNNLIGDQTAVLSGTPPFTTPLNTVYTKGIYIAGTNVLTITGNSIKNVVSYVSTSTIGIELNTAIGSGGVTISNNSIIGVVCNTTSSAFGINIASSASNPTVANNIISTVQTVGNSSSNIAGLQFSISGTSALIEKNQISMVYNRTTNGYGSFGINANGGNNATIQNNFIYDINAFLNNGGLSTQFGPMGIRIAAGTGHKIYNNSVSLSGAVLGSSSFTSSAAFVITSTTLTGLDVRNNIFSNTLTGMPANSSAASIMLPSGGTSGMNLTLNNNQYYEGSGTGASIAQTGTTTGSGSYLATNFVAGSTAPATNLRSYTSTLSAAGTNDNLSGASSLAAPFVSSTNLHINNLDISAPDLDGKAAAIVTVPTDIDGDTRNVTTPDIGADEFALPGCVTADGGTITIDTLTVCANATYTMSSTGATAGTGITYQWEISSTGAGTGFTAVTGGSGASTTTYTTGALAVGTYYYRLNTTCSTGPVTDFSNELVLIVAPNPTVTVTPTSGTFCSPGGSPIALTATGATTYSWTPAAGLSATTGASVNASPATSTSYIVTGSDGTCTSKDTAVITVQASASISDVTATPPAICNGDNSTLNVAAFPAITAAGYLYSTATGAALHTFTAPDTVITNGIDDTPTGTPASIGFNFRYEGTDYTQYSISPDGWILLGGATAVDQFTNNLTSATNAPKISPYWDDVATGTNGYVRTEVTGTAPNRIFVAEWFVTIPRNITGAANSTFQTWLYETSGKIEFRYGTMNPSSMTSSVGLTGATSTNFNSVTISSGTNSTTVANNSNTGQPASGTMYVFEFPSLTYNWTPSTFIAGQETLQSPTATAMTTTTMYYVTATNGACSAMDSVEVAVGSPLVCGSITTTTPVCENEDFTISLNPTGGGAPYSYAWADTMGTVYTDTSDVLLNLMAGNYDFTVIVTDACSNTCTTSTTITVLPPASGTASGPATGETYTDLTYVVTGYPTGATFQWMSSTTAGGPYTNVPGATDDTLIGNVDGATTIYVVCIISNGPCDMTSNEVSTVVTVNGDDVCDAIPLTLGANGPFTNVGATTETGEVLPPLGSCTGQASWCSASGGISHTVWFSFVAPASGRVSLNFLPGDWDSEIALWSADSCGNLTSTGATLLAANDDSTGSSPWNAFIDTICVTPGTTYFVQVDGYATTQEPAFGIALNDVGSAGPTVTTVSQTNASCFEAMDGAVDVTVTVISGATGYNSLWSDSDSTTTDDISGLGAGTYTLTVTDSLGCVTMVDYTITEPAAIDASTTLSGVTITANNTSAIAYQWGFCATTFTPISGATSASYTATADGTYAVIVTEGSCSDTSACVTITGVGIDGFNAGSFSIYPNPTNGMFTIESPDQVNIIITNMIGETVLTQTVLTGKTQFDLANLSRGTYSVRVLSTSGQLIKVERLIVQR